MPTAFELPSEYDKFIEYRNTHHSPDQKWVIKSGKHRNIRILADSELDTLGHIEDKFVQKLVSPPMLINGKKFDIGIYTVITSAEPLRLLRNIFKKFQKHFKKISETGQNFFLISEKGQQISKKISEKIEKHFKKISEKFQTKIAEKFQKISERFQKTSQINFKKISEKFQKNRRKISKKISE
mgnify:CR=1 FL=1